MGLLFREGRRADLEESRAGGGGGAVAAAQSQASLSALNRQSWVMAPPSHHGQTSRFCLRVNRLPQAACYLWSLVSLSVL